MELYRENIIPLALKNNLTEKADASVLLNAVEGKIGLKKKHFHTLVQVLKQEPSMNDLAEKLLTEYQSLVSSDPKSADTTNQVKVHGTELHTQKKYDACTVVQLAGDRIALGRMVSRQHLEYDGKLEPGNQFCQEKSTIFRECVMNGDLAKSTSEIHTISKDQNGNVIAYFMCYHSLVLFHKGKRKEARTSLMQALRMNEAHLDTTNGSLVHGRIYRILAGDFRETKEFAQAEECILKSMEYLQNAAPSCECACTYMERAIILQRNDKRTDRHEVKCLIDTARSCINSCKDSKRREHTIPMLEIEAALFHFHAFDTGKDKQFPKFDLVSMRDIEEGRERLEISQRYTNIKGSKANVYQIRQMVAIGYQYVHKKNYGKAAETMQQALTWSKSDEHGLRIPETCEVFKSLAARLSRKKKRKGFH